jgi:ABC-type transport system involved in cytochrome c biogenesis ATPase subunit
MKLRRLWLGGYRNLQDIAIDFPEPISVADMPPRPPIFLLAGVNGTGKTGILRAVAHIFAQLEDRQAPGISFEVAYQISRGGKSFEVEIKGDGRGTLSGVEVSVQDGEGASRQIDSAGWAEYLPAQTIIYTSGHLSEWHVVLDPDDELRQRRSEERSELLAQQLAAAQEVQEVMGLGDLLDFAAAPPVMAEVIPDRTVLFTSDHLELALLATLAIPSDDDGDYLTPTQRQEIYRRAGVERLRSFSLRLEPIAAHAQESVILEQADLLVRSLLGDRLDEDAALKRRLEELLSWPVPVLPEQQAERIRTLAELAIHRHRNPDGSYHLLFDLDEETRLALGGSQGLFATPKQLFDFLADLQNRGVLARADLILDKSDLTDPILSRHLSGGEHEFLGRMALFLLMRQPESLFLLDEPETHFNDVWKRELVDMLAAVLKGRDSTVLLSTHSSIVISDVAHPQLILLVKDDAGRTQVVDVHTPTFGADPSDIAINILGAPRAGGTLSAARLKAALERGNREELQALLDIVSPGYWRFRIRDRLESLDVTSDPIA